VKCKIHGLLDLSQVYVHKRKEGNNDYECKECVKFRLRKHYHNNKVEFSRKKKLRYIEDPIFKKKALDNINNFYRNNKELVKSRVRGHKIKLKIEVLTHYSNGIPKCLVCNESNTAFLCLDHINDDGHGHRKLDLGAKHPYMWAKRNEFPLIFQVLCHNHNMIKEYERVKGKSESAKQMARLKLEVFTHYSGGIPKCAICGIDDIRALSIDHVNGGGAQHRKSIKVSLHRDLKNKNFPEGYQVLCHNHNLGKHCLGV
jgi:hypothetical protein